MRRSAKPVRKCHPCPLNLGDRCWVYASPRDQWRNRSCPGFSSEDLAAQYRQWLKRPQVKTREDLRRESVGARRRPSVPSARRPKRGDRH